MNKFRDRLFLILFILAVVFVTASCSCSNNQEPTNSIGSENTASSSSYNSSEQLSASSSTQASENNDSSSSQTLISSSTSVCMHTGEKINVEGVLATCTKKGLTAGQKCADCGLFIIPQFETPMLMHTQENIPSVQATCKTHGKTEGIRCSVCNQILIEQTETPFSSHTVKTINGKLPTCIETGLTDGKMCEVCDEIITNQEVIEKIDHTRYSEYCEHCGISVASKNLAFIDYGNGYALSGLGQCTDKNIVIPSKYNSKPVLKINADAFDNSINSIYIPASVTSIESNAFENAKNLKKVYIDDLSAWCKILFGNLTANPLYVAHKLYLCGQKIVTLTLPPNIYRVNDYAFCGADIEAIVLPDNLSLLNDIGDYAFYGCYRLWEVYNLSQRLSPIKGSMTYGYLSYYAKDIYVSLSMTNISRVDGLILHTKLDKVTLLGINSEEENLVLPNTINAINDYAFYGNNTIKSIVINSEVIEIGNYAFANSVIENITVQDNSKLTKIGISAFENARQLAVVSLPQTITQIGENAFKDTTSLIVNSINGINYIGNSSQQYLYLINADSSITTCQMQVTTRIICSNAFVNCNNLTSVVIPDCVIEIGENAFKGLKNLNQIKLSESLERIKSGAFADLTRLYSITLPKYLNSISSDAFSGCYCLVEVYNLSNLSIKNSTDNGSVGLYALDIYSSELQLSKLMVRANQLVIYDGVKTQLIVCLIDSEKVAISKVDKIYEYAFYENSNLLELQFNGSVANWNSVEKPQNLPESLVKVVCLDGEVLL